MPLLKASGPRQTPPQSPTAGSPAAEPAPAEPAAALDDSDPAARRRAAHALAGRPEAAAGLCARLAREDDHSVREAILAALSRVGTAEAVAGMLPHLASEDVALRNGVIETLQQMPADAVAPRVEPLLGDADSDVRIFAVQIVSHLDPERRLAWLGRVVERDPHVNVALAALEGLVETALPAVLPLLDRLRARFPDDPIVAFTVDAAHRRLRSEP